jgi:hypothetical protein
VSELIWPAVDDYGSARQTSRYGTAWAWVLGGLACIAAILAGNSLFYLFSLLYSVTGWGIWRGSVAASIGAFVLCILQTIAVVISLPLMWAIVMPFAFLGLMNGVLGVMLMQKTRISNE